MTGQNAPKSCPSAPCAPGATLLGIRGGDGKIHNVRTPMQIDQDFVDVATQTGAPEARMRFASKCETSGCAQWRGEKCGVIERLMDRMHRDVHQVPDPRLQPCVIRQSCRWFSQRGGGACEACAMAITDQSELAEPA